LPEATRPANLIVVDQLGIASTIEEMPMPRPNRQLPTVQFDLFRPSSPQGLNWLGLSAEVREKVTRLIARMLSRHEPGNLPIRREGGGDDE
jgi:hypothetical protein